MKRYLVICSVSVFVSMTVLICGGGCGSSSTSTSTPTSQSLPELQILANGQLVPGVPGHGLGVDDSQHQRNWVSRTTDSQRMQYPDGLAWGAVFIVVGNELVDQNRPSQDFSPYSRLRIEMKGAVGGECVQIGLKDKNDPDDGTETKRSQQLTGDWNWYEFNLSDFTTCQLNQVYVVTEFVFPCTGPNTAQTIDVRNITLVK